MAIEHVLGSLVVRLIGDQTSLDSATEKGKDSLKKVDKQAQSSAKSIANATKNIATAFVGAMTTVAIAVGATIKSASELSKLAQSLGTTTEELSRLQYAASQSGVAAEVLRVGIVTLSKGLQDATKNATGPAAQALDALGISAMGTGGHIKDQSVIILELADKFEKMRDGAGKTALAVQLFGEAGARLVPLLNKGRAGVQELKDEADKLGVTLSEGTGAASEEFTKTLGKMWATVQGGLLIIAEKLLPTLQMLADKFFDSGKATEWFKGVAYNLAIALKGVLSVSAILSATWEIALNTIGAVGRALMSLAKGQFTQAYNIMNDNAAKNTSVIEEHTKYQADLWNQWAASVTTAASTFHEGVAAPVIGSTTEMMTAQEQLNLLVDDFNRKQEEGKAIQEGLRDPMQQHQADLVRLQELYAAGTISAQDYARAAGMSAATMKGAYASAASAITGALTALFQNNKSVAIANALVNTYQAMNAALAAPPGPPFSYAYVAAAAAQGFANVRSIMSTNKNSSGGGTAPASSASRGGGSSGGGGGGGESLTRTLNVTGLNPRDLYRGDAVRYLADEFVKFTKDGGQIQYQGV
jgi:hypothetical protein